MKLSNAAELRVIGGNPLVARGSSEGNRPQLALVWINSVSEKTAKKEKRDSRVSVARNDSSVSGMRKGWQWLNANAGGLGLLLVAIPMLVGAVWFAFDGYARFKRMEEKITSIDEAISGKGSRKGLLTRMAAVETRLNARLKKRVSAKFGIEDAQIDTVAFSPSAPPPTLEVVSRETRLTRGRAQPGDVSL